MSLLVAALLGHVQGPPNQDIVAAPVGESHGSQLDRGADVARLRLGPPVEVAEAEAAYHPAQAYVSVAVPGRLSAPRIERKRRRAIDVVDGEGGVLEGSLGGIER